MNNWRFLGSCVDSSKFTIRGIDVWKHKWVPIRGRGAVVTDPIYKVEKTFQIFEIKGPAETIQFAAGEFSNCVWGFYQEE